MSPPEFLIALSGMAFVYFLISKIMNYVKWENQAKIDLEKAKIGLLKESDELSVSELQVLIEKAVEKGLLPVNERLDALENKNKAPLTDVLLSDDPITAPSKSVGREMA
jgi:hypothetical protein